MKSSPHGRGDIAVEDHRWGLPVVGERVIEEDEMKVGAGCGLLAMEADQNHNFGVAVRGAKDAAWVDLMGCIGLVGQPRVKGDRCRIVVSGALGAGQASYMDYAAGERWRRVREGAHLR